MTKGTKNKNRQDMWTTPALVVLILLHIILITTIFVIHARRRGIEGKHEVKETIKASSAPMTPSEFLAQREKLLKEKIGQESQAFQELVSVYKAEGRMDDAASVLESAIAREPDREDLRMELGLLYYSRPDTVEKALDHFRKVLELNPNHAQKRIIELWLKQGSKVKPQKSVTVDDLKQLLARDPGNAELNYKIGLIYAASQKTELEAILYLEKVLELAPDHRAKDKILEELKRLKTLAETRKSK